MRPIRFAVLLLLMCAALAQAQDTAPQAVIGVADQLEITVLGAPDFSRSLRVSEAGAIRLPFIGEVEVRGMTPRQAEAKLTSLLDGQYVVDPQVSVEIKEPRSRTYSILGAVQRPGQVQMLESVTLVSAIAAAGGLDLGRAGSSALIQRLGKDQMKVNLQDLFFKGDLTLDIPILPGDIISVPERVALSFFVVGDVTNPGPFEFPKEQGMKLSRALAMAGGPTKTSKMKDSLLVRQQSDGSVERIALDMGRVLKGKDPDFDLRPNDLLFVPGSVGKTLGWAILGYIPQMATWTLVR
jgi:polysaccharide export outer membrane protein